MVAPPRGSLLISKLFMELPERGRHCSRLINMATKKRKREIEVNNENSFDEEHLTGIDKRRRLERGRSNRRIKVRLVEPEVLINVVFNFYDLLPPRATESA